MSRKDYVEAARILRETPMASETRAALVARFVTMFSDDNARFSPSRFREAAEPERFVVIENTPGYLPDDDDPPVFDSYSDAVAYANGRADEYEHDPDGSYDVDRSWASRDNTYCVMVHDRDREHDLGRVIEVVRYEEEGSC